jgi:hypothetical protein
MATEDQKPADRDAPPSRRSPLDTPATFWFAALEIALRDGDMETAKRAHDKLVVEHGVRVTFTNLGSRPRRRMLKLRRGGEAQ